MSSDTRSGGLRDLLERSAQLSSLADALAAVAAGRRGRLVLARGEAGAGKTVLLRRFCEHTGGNSRVLWGSCDPLFTPRPLGPLADIAQNTGGELAELVASGAKPHEVALGLTRELRHLPPAIVVLEDVHWADEATLDVLRLIGRRLEAVPALVVVTYRDDELDRSHPLRIVLGELGTSGAIVRLELEPLSQAAVAKLAAPARRRLRGAVSQDGRQSVLRDRGAGGRRRGDPTHRPGRRALPHGTAESRSESTARGRRRRAVARRVVAARGARPEAMDSLEECAASGVLRLEPKGVGFRHELARLAIEESMSPHLRESLHAGRSLALGAPPNGEPDLARLAHHAEAAGDAEAVMRFAPAAGAVPRRSGRTARLPPSMPVRSRSPAPIAGGASGTARAPLVRVLPHRAVRTSRSRRGKRR